MSEWVLATANPGKLAEMATLLDDLTISLRPQSAFGVVPEQETAPTFVENAIAKARHAARLSGLPAIADDSGLCVDALDGAPGICSARFAGPLATDDENIDKLLATMAKIGTDARHAHFVCTIVALRDAQDPIPIIATGYWHGRIAASRQGAEGFGYDPIFLVGDGMRTAAQLSGREKHSLSHRGKAVMELKRRLLQCDAGR